MDIFFVVGRWCKLGSDDEAGSVLLLCLLQARKDARPQGPFLLPSLLHTLKIQIKGKIMGEIIAGFKHGKDFFLEDEDDDAKCKDDD